MKSNPTVKKSNNWKIFSPDEIKYPVYLARDGRSYGPYTEEEFSALMESSALQNYSWIWMAEQWRALDPPPSSGPGIEMATLQAASSFSAVLYNQERAIRGQLKMIEKHGCKFICETPMPSPCFGLNGQVLINLINLVSGQAVDVPVELTSIVMEKGQWTYQVAWDRLTI